MNNELIDAIRKEIYFMFHGDIREVPEAFEQKVAEYVEEDADDLWNLDDVRVAIHNVIYAMMIDNFAPYNSPKRLEVETPLGTLFAEPQTGDDYPGIYTGIRRNGQDFSFNLLEVDTVGEKPLLKQHVWGNTTETIWDDPVFDMISDEQTLDKLNDYAD